MQWNVVLYFHYQLHKSLHVLYLQESCGFKTTGEVTQVYRLDRSYHGDVCLAGTSEMPLAGNVLQGLIDVP